MSSTFVSDLNATYFNVSAAYANFTTAVPDAYTGYSIYTFASNSAGNAHGCLDVGNAIATGSGTWSGSSLPRAEVRLPATRLPRRIPPAVT